MQENQLLKRALILDQHRQIVAYQCVTAPETTTAINHGASIMTTLVAALLPDQDADTFTPAPDLGYFLCLPVQTLDLGKLASLSIPVVVCFQAGANLSVDLAVLEGLQQHKLTTCLHLPSLNLLAPQHLQANYIQIEGWQTIDEVIAAIEAHPALLSKLIMAGTQTTKDFDTLRQVGIQWFSGSFYLQPPAEAGKVTHPGFESVLNLLNLVSQDADNKTIEQGFKRDTTLSYKLLRYINSVGFGLSCEVQSLNHALTILGRQQLYRWLTLLLVTAGNHEACPALMKASIIRGRFMELLGEPFFDRHGKDNLFVVGVFSLLDRMLNQPMPEVLEKLKLPEAIVEALTTRSGIYAPFLNLILALETLDSQSAALAEALQLQAAQVNQCHLEAIRWAEAVMH
ncbi:MAG TPA: HDOD domain-containing protein [Methylophilus sp.]